MVKIVDNNWNNIDAELLITTLTFYGEDTCEFEHIYEQWRRDVAGIGLNDGAGV